jgi:hypothetical protein
VNIYVHHTLGEAWKKVVKRQLVKTMNTIRMKRLTVKCDEDSHGATKRSSFFVLALTCNQGEIRPRSKVKQYYMVRPRIMLDFCPNFEWYLKRSNRHVKGSPNIAAIVFMRTLSHSECL